jgi:hypothetical protein
MLATIHKSKPTIMKKSIMFIGMLLILSIPIYAQYYGTPEKSFSLTGILIAYWVIGSFIVAGLGGWRKIGFMEVLVISLFLSPLIGAICMATSPKDDEWKLQVEIHDMLNQLRDKLAPRPEANEEITEIDDGVDYGKEPIIVREELMKKYGITYNSWNERYKYVNTEYGTFNEVIRVAFKQEGKK